ncbi:putative chromatin regulator PHD family [Helianthus annuus]|nr:putative chromatin regulator PHD family [Helianthus annuus]
MATKHEHPLNLVDLWSEQLQHEEESEEEEDEDEVIAKQDFKCMCSRCDEEINWVHRYYYTCGQCKYSIHKFCEELPEKYKDICHVHPVYFLEERIYNRWICSICRSYFGPDDLYYHCSQCNFDVDIKCAIKRQQKNIIYHPSHEHPLVRIPKDLLYECDACPTNKCDKHPMKLSYFPVENHKSDYFCEVCERQLNPEMPFYHCHDCMQSMHTACAPSILQYETYDRYRRGVYEFVNVKFGGTYENTKVHPHPLSFLQGVESDGRCHKDGWRLQFEMIFKCSTCEFALEYDCCSETSE